MTSTPSPSAGSRSRLREDASFATMESGSKGLHHSDPQEIPSSSSSPLLLESGSKAVHRTSRWRFPLAAALTIFTSSQYNWRIISVAAFSTIFTGSLGILTTLSKENGTYAYDYATIPFFAELIKLLVCALLLWRESRSSKGPPPRMSLEWRIVRLYPIPSIIYLVHNNVQFATLFYLDPSTYQILGNLKIVTTGVMFRFFLGRRLTRLQWMALVLLTLGTTTSQITCGHGSSALFSAPLPGYLLALLSACLSALGGVYTEFLMKKNDDSIYWQNLQLYIFGVLFNALNLSLEDVRAHFTNGLWWGRLTAGYDGRTWAVVFNLAFTGLLVSWIMKFADNIVKVYATSMAMLLTMLLSIFLFDFHPTIQLFIGILICGMSLQMYFTPAAALLAYDGENKENNKLTIISSSPVASKQAS